MDRLESFKKKLQEKEKLLKQTDFDLPIKG